MNNGAMLSVLLPVLCICAVYAESIDTAASEAEPEYKILYEEGFYDKALQLMDSIAAAETLFSETVHYYRAACLIAKGDTGGGARAFATILEHNCDYSLDTLFTPPKILTVYRAVQTGFSCKEETEAASDTAVTTSTDTIGDSTDVKTGPGDTLIVPLIADTLKTETALPVRISLGVMPAGAGQWYQRKRIRGALIASAQIAAIAGCIWSYNIRESYYSNRYGWYKGNRSAYEKYTNYARFGVTIFIGSYVYGCIDYFLINE
jgi:hypothetical protein